MKPGWQARVLLGIEPAPERPPQPPMKYTHPRCPSCGRFTRWDVPRGAWFCDLDERTVR